MVVSIYIPTNSAQRSNFSTSSPILVIFWLLIVAISKDVKWYLIVLLIYISVMTSGIEIFSCVYWPSVCLLWKKCLSRSSAYFSIRLFGFWLLNCMNYLYVLDINPLSDNMMCKYFLPLVGYLFILLMVSFAVQKLFNLRWFHLFIFHFGVRFEKLLPRPMSRSLPLCFVLGVLWFQVLHSSL